MIHLTTDAPELYGDICEVVRLFWPDAQISLTEGTRPLAHRHEQTGGRWRETWSFDGRALTHEAVAVVGGLEERRAYKRALKTGLFLLLRQLTGATPPWGSLTGIRPTRLLYEARADGMNEAEAERFLTDTFYVEPARARLLTEILSMQRGLIEREQDEYDLYIGIPFCVTRCAYCSFASDTLGDGRLVEPYLAALWREMEGALSIVQGAGLRVRACYLGGGTPTALTAEQLGRVLERAQALFPGAREWTVEAGRPDTIDRAKLAVMRDAGVGRVSVNPQTFSDETLRRIGRAHTSEDTLKAYELARGMGFEVNMDLIAALPGESAADFEATLDQVIALMPHSVTVHALAIKRASRLHEQAWVQPEAGEAARMVELARARLGEAGYNPYYLYRQKYMAGNLENVGYALRGRACVYNIDIMEETAPILALGAGAITKWLFPRERRIERAPNVKNVEHYIARVEEMIERKRRLIEGGEQR